ncbi:MAG: protein kinase domain-containing protein [Candidatus Acidiferrales bacterium]
MMPEDWLRVRSILEPALELNPPDRSRFLDDVCTDAVLRRDVESLIELHEQAGTDFLNSPPIPAEFAGDDDAQFHLTPGSRVGAYKILGEIAQGGMGAVYRAVRADGQYTQEVALKVLRSGSGAELTAARFRNERQILASLDHPNIAKLFDGGTTADGRPYFVMELIDGLPITAYSDQRMLSIEARLKLFHAVCTAVQYAHQRLVIHRDIKPTNILVTPDGIPKLLDFGIAKVLDPNLRAPNSTVTAGLWMMTPEYASPEQLRGEVVTTATDVYSLGLVLYELLTGRRAYRLDGKSPHEMAQLVCSFEPQRPSLAIGRDDSVPSEESQPRKAADLCSLRGCSPARLKKQLSGDLDTIALMALRKDSSRRYASVEQFAEDVRRHLDRVPVTARDDTAWYRVSKFVGRHKAGVAAGVIVSLTILGGLALILHEAQVAREQAAIARQQRARAERRFNDVRKLANSLMFEVHDSIKDLPGATHARKLLVERAQEYLDSLSQEASGDLALQRELADAYDRVGDLLGYTGAANLGDFDGAQRSYKKALAIRESAAASAPGDAQAQGELLNDYFRMSFVRQDAGDFPGALSYLQKALPVAQKLAATHPEPKYQEWLAGFYWKTGNVQLEAGEYAQARDNLKQAILVRQPIASGANANPLYRTHLASDYISLGRALAGTGDVPHALVNTSIGLQMLEQLIQADPTNATLREYLAEEYSFVAHIHADRRDFDEAMRNTQKALRIFAELRQSDPSDTLARDNLGLNEVALGEILIDRGRVHEAQPHVRKAISIFEPIERKNRHEIEGQSEAYSALAKSYVVLASRETAPAKRIEQSRRAESWYQKSLESWRQDQYPPPENSPGVRSAWTAAGIAECEAALAKLRTPK